MAPMTFTQSFVVQLSPVEVHDQILATFGSMSARVQTDSDTYIEAKTGSQLAMRLKGGMWGWTKLTEFPMQTSVALRSEGQGTAVQVTATDALGFGRKTGMKAKYQQALQAMVEELRAAVGGGATEVLPAPPRPDR